MADEGLKKSEYPFYKGWSVLNKPIEADLLIVGNSRAACMNKIEQSFVS